MKTNLLKNKLLCLLALGLLGQLSFTSCTSYSQKRSWVNSVYDKSLTFHNNRKHYNKITNKKQPINHTYYSVPFQNLLDITTQSELTANNKLNLLLSQQSIKIKLDLIEKAKKTIFISTFDMFCDQNSKKIITGLKKALSRGVEVYFLYDGSLIASSGKKCRQKMKKLGVKVLRSKNTFVQNQQSQRIHEKLFIVDLDKAIIGGTNYGEWYFGKDNLGRDYRDTDLFVSGPLVSDIASRFFTLWNYFAGSNNKLNKYFKILEKIKEKERKQKIRGSKNYTNWLAPKNRKGLCRFVKQEPLLHDFALFDAYIYLAENATREISWSSVYLDTIHSHRHLRLNKAFKKLAKSKNGRVNIFINGAGTSHILPPLVGKIASKLWLSQAYDSTIDSNILLYLYSTWFHSKMVIFDNIVVSVGSFNLNESASTWTESNAICMDKALAKQAQKQAIDDMKNSMLVLAPKANQPYF